MSGIQNFIGRIKTFIEEVRQELKKCTWPTRDELLQSTVVVIISVLIVGTFVGLSDVILMGFLRLVIR